MKTGMTHDEALDAIVGASRISTLSYQEAVETYLRLRRLDTLFTDKADTAFDDPRIQNVSVSA